MAGRRLSLGLIAAAAAIAGAGCGGGGGGAAKCVMGQVIACPGPNGCSGSQTCQANGTYGDCACVGGGTAGAGGTADGTGGGAGTGSGGTAGGGGGVAGGGGTGGGRGGATGTGGTQTVPCDPVSQQPCAADQRCGWVQTGATGHSACLPDGTIDEGAFCTFGLGTTDRCRRGTACAAGTCMKLCGLSPDTCPSGWACGRYTEVPFNLDGNGSTGYCNPLCDPLTQARSFDQAPACGSADPLQPDLGCYGDVGGIFTCGPAGSVANGSGAPAPLSPSGAAYQNGCAPGFLPVLYASSSNLTVICAALCEPGPTSAQSPANAKGRVGSPYTCPARGAGGSNECRYWWYLEDTNAPDFPTELSNTMGVCVDYTKYSYDRDGNGSLDTVYPSCTALSSSGHTWDSYWTDDVIWSCAPLQ